MRTTITLDPDVEALVRRRMRERGIGFKQAVNEALREGLVPEGAHTPFETPSFDLGGARVEVTRALELAGYLENEAFLHKRALRK